MYSPGEEGDGDKGQDNKSPEQQKKSISMYARLVGKRNEGSDNSTPSSSVRDKIVNFFARESAETRQLRAQLKSHKHRLHTENQNITKANAKHHKRLLDQFIEFRKQEKQLCSWGLKFAVPTFRMQAWVRLSRSSLLQEMSSELQVLVEEQLAKTLQRLKQIEGNPSKSDIQTISNSEDLCLGPEAIMEKDPSLSAKSKRLLRLDVQCNLTTKKFRLYERDFAWKDQQTRKAILVDILTRYKALPKLDDLPNLETDMEWEEYCDWYADRSQQQAAIEAEYFDFIEDQREKEGRLFFRWCTAVMPSEKTDDMESAFPLSESDQRDAATSSGENNADDASNGGAGVNGVEGSQHNINGLTALKMTPTSIKAFIQYFANDVVGIHYGIPRDCIEVNMQLTEALFFRRIHLFVMRYPNDDVMRRDEHWRLQSQLCRFVNPLTYHVPEEYLVDNVTEANKIKSKHRHSNGSRRSETTSVAAAVSSSAAGVASPPGDVLTPTLAMKANISLDSVNDASDGDLSYSRSSGMLGTDLTSALTAESVPVSPSSLPPAGIRSISGGNSTVVASVVKPLHPKPCNCRNCRTFGLSKRLQQLPTFAQVEYGSAYARSARVMSLLTTSITPREVIFNLSLAYKWLLRDAIDASGSRSTIGADLLVPLFTLVVINARIPNIHMIVNFLMLYGSYDEQGDVSYSIANLEGSILFIMEMAIPKEISSKFEGTDLYRSIQASTNKITGKPSPYKSVSMPVSAGGAENKMPTSPGVESKAPAAGGGKKESATDEDYMAMAQLGEWLRDQQTMEDTITILQKDGWMA